MTENAEQPAAKGPEAMAQLIIDDGRYPLDAFEFLHDGLAPAEPGRRHVSGAELCCSLRDQAVDRWGPLARTVLRRWRINATDDFGNMVYLLVNNDFMQKTERDSIEDFRQVYDFDQAFTVRVDFKLKE